MPVTAGAAASVAAGSAISNAHEEQMSPPPAMPAASLGRAIPEPESEDDEPETGPDPGRGAAQAAATTSMGQEAMDEAPSSAAAAAGGRARAEYDYEAAEDNEVSMQEGHIPLMMPSDSNADLLQAK